MKKLVQGNMGAELSLPEIEEIHLEIEHQPRWRDAANREMDFADGNQLDSELLRKQQELGIPPAIENMIGPVMLAMQGYEVAQRQDWRVTPNGQPDGQETADALNFELNQAESESGADKACSDAFRPQAGVGVGWVEVSESSDPFEYKYQCKAVHRNEIHWDMKGERADLLDARWLRRRRWIHPADLLAQFPQHEKLLRLMCTHGANWDMVDWATEGYSGTGLADVWGQVRGSSVHEHFWYDPSNKHVAVCEYWYRRWVSGFVLKSPDGRVIEYDDKNPVHVAAVLNGTMQVERAPLARVRRAYWIGPHKLFDSPSPYPHRYFPYAPFWGFKEDNTGVPYGYIRGMIYQQESLNSGISKLRWGMSSVRVTLTDGVTDMTDAQIRKQVGRVDGIIRLKKSALADNGKFDVDRDYQLNEQQLRVLDMSRAAMERVGPATSGFMGRKGNATSGLQEQTQVEQSNQLQETIMDNFRAGRKLVGEMLLSLLIRDIGDRERAVVIEGDAVRADRTVVLNKLERDPAGYTYLANDVRRTRLKVALEDVPSTRSFRTQQLQALSESVKSLPEQYRAAALPFMTQFMDMPYKRELVEAFRAVANQQSPEEIQKAIEQARAQGKEEGANELKRMEVESKVRVNDAKAVQIGVQSSYSAMQGAAQVVTMPQVAPIADVIMQGAGYKAPSPMGDDPNFPTPTDVPVQPAPQQGGQGSAELMDVQANTSPAFPPVPQQPGQGLDGIETPQTSDNMG